MAKDLSNIMVIFGGTGDLTRRKLIPAIYNLMYDGQLPVNFAVVCVGRREKSNEEYRKELYAGIERFTRFKADESLWEALSSRIYYYRMDFTDNAGYGQLKAFLDEMDKKHIAQGNRIFYLAVSPEYFGPIVERLKANHMVDNNKSWQRLVIEKPFGRDLASARKLNEIITGVFHEKNIYRIDHYLGKEMLQNIMVVRFANFMFESVWNSKYIDNIQISASEIEGVGTRGGYYEGAGALRDMVQNHLLQLLALVAMEPPVMLDAESVRDEKVKVFRSLEELRPEIIKTNVVRGQYGSGVIDGKHVPGYREEDKVAPDSDTETFVAMKVFLNNFRWAGMPFYIKTGKRLPTQSAEIVIQFKSMPEVLYFKKYGWLEPNLLVIKVQPRESIYLQFNAKKPGTGSDIVPVRMDFCQNCGFESNSPEAYERLVLDVMRGDNTLFTRWDEVEASWRFVDTISAAWAAEKPAFPNYAPGQSGPRAAEKLLSNDGRLWWNV